MEFSFSFETKNKFSNFHMKGISTELKNEGSNYDKIKLKLYIFKFMYRVRASFEFFSTKFNLYQIKKRISQLSWYA